MAECAAREPVDSLCGAAAAGVNLSASFARSFGVDPGMSGDIFGAMRFRGTTGPGGIMDPKQFVLMPADSISSSGMFAKSAEIMQAFARYVTTPERSGVSPGGGSADTVHIHQTHEHVFRNERGDMIGTEYREQHIEAPVGNHG